LTEILRNFLLFTLYEISMAHRLTSPLFVATLILSQTGAVSTPSSSFALVPPRGSSAQLAPVRAPDPKDLLKKAAANIAKAKSLHFTLAAHPVTPGSRLAALVSGEGNVVLPDTLVFQGSMQTTPALAMSIVSAMCGPDQYLEFGDGNFQKMAGAPNVHRLLFSPDSGLVTGILTKLEGASAATAATLDKLSAWKISGTIPTQLLAHLPGRTAATPTKTPVRVQLWIGQQDSQLHQLVISGVLFDGDSAETVRTLTFSQFNEALKLTVPRGHSPCTQ
jgi:hypothetical protein